MKSIIHKFVHEIEYKNEHGLLHREDGPAIVWNDGTKAWFINGEYHREDGPAIEWSDGSKFWYLNDKNYSEDEWKQEVTRLKLKRILDL
jgi:hypothetical protein